MVYIGNILISHAELKDNQEIRLCYDGNNVTHITSEDNLGKQSGDLKINRPNGTTVFVDCAEVKYMIIGRRFI